MKAVKFLVCFVLISLLLTISPASAQENNPPDRELEEAGEDQLDLADLETLGVDIKGDTFSPSITWEAPPAALTETKNVSENRLTNEESQQPINDLMVSDFDSLPDADPLQPSYIGPAETLSREEKSDVSVDSIDTRVVYPNFYYIPVAVSSSLDEYGPAIAHGDGYYMVAYLINGNIWARVYDANGKSYAGGSVYDGPSPCSNLSIAYESKTGYFIIAFQYYFGGTDYDIRAIAVSPHIGYVGTVKSIAETIEHEDNPSVACNARTGTCLVAYEYASGNPIQGRFLYIDNTGLWGWSVYQFALDIYPGYRPHLAWGNGTGNYFLTYSWWYSATSEYFPIYTHLWDVYHTPPQYMHTGYSAVPEAWSPGLDKEPLGVAYDPCTNRYVLMFYQEFTSSDKDIYVMVFGATSVTNDGWGAVADTIDYEYTGDISFVTDDHVAPICGLGDRVVVTYKNATDGVYATDLRGNNNKTTPIYYWDSEALHALVAPDYVGLDGYDPVIASGTDGKMFIAWNWYYITLSDDDVMGRMIKVYWTEYVPLMAK